MMRSDRLFRLAMILGLACVTPPASAEPGVLLADARAADTDNMATGDQLLLTGRDGALRFAGRELGLTGFSGILGYASEVAYVVVIEGEVRAGGTRVGRGRMLLIPPYGATTSVQRFDAGRLRDRWSAAARTAQPAAFERLDALAAGQHRGLFLGRLSRTRFNVTAPRGAERELAGRALLGEPTIRSIRFDARSDAAAVERRIVDAFRAALLASDVEAVAALLDPMPFGGRRLGGGAREARVVAARTLVASRDWAALFGSAEPVAAEGQWRIGGARLTLRNVDDFAFVRTIEGGL